MKFKVGDKVFYKNEPTPAVVFAIDPFDVEDAYFLAFDTPVQREGFSSKATIYWWCSAEDVHSGFVGPLTELETLLCGS